MGKIIKSEYLQFSSSDRSAGTASDFTITLTNSINNLYRIRLEYGRYCTSFYNQGTLTLLEGVTSFTLTLPNQHLTTSTFATWLQTELNTDSPTPLTYTVTYDSVQDQYTIAATGNFSITGYTKDFLRMIGFSPENLPIQGASTYTSTGLAQLLAPSIRLYIKNLGTVNIDSKQYCGQFILPITGNFLTYSIISRTSFGYAQEILIGGSANQYLSTFQCQFQDISGNPINMNGVDSDFVFTVETMING